MLRGILRRTVVGGLSAGLLLNVAAVDPASAQGKARYAMHVPVLGNTAFELAGVGAQEGAAELINSVGN